MRSSPTRLVVESGSDPTMSLVVGSTPDGWSVVHDDAEARIALITINNKLDEYFSDKKEYEQNLQKAKNTFAEKVKSSIDVIATNQKNEKEEFGIGGPLKGFKYPTKSLRSSLDGIVKGYKTCLFCLTSAKEVEAFKSFFEQDVGFFAKAYTTEHSSGGEGVKRLVEANKALESNAKREKLLYEIPKLFAGIKALCASDANRNMPEELNKLLCKELFNLTTKANDEIFSNSQIVAYHNALIENLLKIERDTKSSVTTYQKNYFTESSKKFDLEGVFEEFEEVRDSLIKQYGRLTTKLNEEFDGNNLISNKYPGAKGALASYGRFLKSGKPKESKQSSADASVTGESTIDAHKEWLKNPHLDDCEGAESQWVTENKYSVNDLYERLDKPYQNHQQLQDALSNQDASDQFMDKIRQIHATGHADATEDKTLLNIVNHRNELLDCLRKSYYRNSMSKGLEEIKGVANQFDKVKDYIENMWRLSKELSGFDDLGRGVPIRFKKQNSDILKRYEGSEPIDSIKELLANDHTFQDMKDDDLYKEIVHNFQKMEASLLKSDNEVKRANNAQNREECLGSFYLGCKFLKLPRGFTDEGESSDEYSKNLSSDEKKLWEKGYALAIRDVRKGCNDATYAFGQYNKEQFDSWTKDFSNKNLEEFEKRFDEAKNLYKACDDFRFKEEGVVVSQYGEMRKFLVSRIKELGKILEEFNQKGFHNDGLRKNFLETAENNLKDALPSDTDANLDDNIKRFMQKGGKEIEEIGEFLNKKEDGDEQVHFKIDKLVKFADQSNGKDGSTGKDFSTQTLIGLHDKLLDLITKTKAAKNAIAAHRTKIAKEKQVQGSAVANELAALHPARIEDAAVVLAALRDKANAGDPVATQAIKDISTGGKLAEDTRIKDIVANEARLQANGELAVARAETGVTGAINTLVDHPAGNGNENANANATAAANAAKNAIAAHRTKIAKEKQVQGSAVANELAALHPARIEDAAVVLAALRDKANAGDPVATQAIKDISTGGKLAEDTRIKDIVANEARLQANGELAVARAETGVTGAINTLVDHPAGNGNENANANATAAANAAKNAIAAHRTKIAKEKQVQGSAVANELAALHPARIEDAAVVLAALRDKANAGDPVATQAIKDISTGGKLAEDTRIKDIVANEARLQANGELAVARAETGVTGAINTLVDHPAGNGNENANANATAAANAAKNAIAAHRTKIAKEKQVQGSAVANELAALHPARIEDAAVVLAALRDKANAGDPVATQAIKDISTGGKLAEDTRIKDIVANEARLQANGELAVARAETGVTGAINTLVDHPAGNGNENANANATAAANAAKNAIAAHRTKIAKEKQVQGSAVANELAALHPARIEDAAVVLAALRDKANAGDPVATQAIKDISTGGKLAEDTRIKDIVANEARLQANGELAVARAETGVTGAINTLVDHPAGNGNENANANATAAANAAKNAIAAHRTKIAKEKQVQGSAVANELAALHPARIEDAAVVLAALRDKANAGDPVATQAIKDISTGGKLAEDTRIKDIVANEARLQANGELAVARAETGVTGAINTLVDHPAGNGNENANANATAAANAAKNAIAAHRTKIAKEKQVQGSAVANELAALHPARIEDAAVVLAALRDKANAGDPVATQAIKDISTGGKLAEDTRIKDIVANEARLQANGELAVARAETGVTGAINTLVDHPAGNGNENANANATAAANAAKNAIAAHRTKIAKEKQVQGSAVANELAALHPARIEDAAVVLAALRDKANAGDPVATQAIKDISTGGKLAEDTRIKDIVANEARLQANGELAVARAETGVTGAINTLVDHPAGNGNENANANATAAANAAKNAIAAHRTKIAKEKQVQGSAVANELAALHPARIEDAAVVLAALRDKANAGDPVATQAIKDISTGGKLAEDTRIKDIVANEARLQANGELAVARAETGVTGAINTLVDHPAGNGNENANANATAAANAAKNAIAAHRTKIAKEKQVQGSAVANELAALHPARIEDAAVVLAALRDKANAGDPVATQAIKDISTGGKLAEDTRIKDIVANEARLQANGELAVARAETGVTGAINTLVDHPAGNGNENANANATAAANAAKNAIAAHRTKIAKEKQVQGSAVANELAALHPARIEDAAVVLAALRDKANAGDPVATQAIKDISTGGKLAEDTRIKDIVANEARLQANGELAVARAETGVTGAINTLVDHPAGNGNENANANATAAANAAKNAIAAHRTKIAKEKQVQGSAVANELAALHPARIEDAAVVLAALRDKANAGDPVATQAIKDISTGGKLAEDTRIKDIVANEARLQANGELAVARAETGVTGAINTLVDHPAGNGNENANANATAAANAAKNAIAAHRTKIAKEKQVQGSAVANELAALHPARIEDAAVVLAALRDKANAGDPVATQAIKDISTGGKLAEDTRIKDIVANEARLQANGELAVARAETGVTGAINTLVDHPAGNGNENANANATAAANAAKNAIAAHRTKIAKEKQVQGSAVANELAALHPARIEDAAVVLAALRDKANAGDPVATQAIKDISTGGKLAEDTRIKDIVANEARLQANGELAVARAETGVTGAINTLVDHPAGNGNENANANATAAANAAKNAIAAHRTKIAKEKQVQGSAVANELAALHPARIEDAAVVLAALRDKANAGDPVATQAIKDISTGGKLAEDTRIKDIVANEARLQANGELAVARAETGVTGAINTLVDHPAGNGNENANANATAAANAAKNAIAAHRTKIAKEKQVQGSAVANELAALHPARIEDAAVVLAALRDKANAGDPVATQAIKDISTGGKLAEDTRIKDIVANEARLQANGELAVARAETGVTGAINTLVDHPAGNGNENANANATAAANAAKNAIAAHRTKIAKEKQVQGSAVANELAALHPARIEDAAVVLAALRDKANAGDPVATQAIKDISTGGKLAEDTRIKDIVANEARLQANGELAVARAETGVTGAINTLVDHPAGNGNENANANATAAANAAKNAIAAHRTKIAKEKQVQGSAVANELAALHPARIEDAAVVLAALRDKANAGDPVATQAIKDISTGGKLAEDTRIKDIVANEARLQANGELAVARAETGVTGAINTLVDHPAGNGNENANANATAAANAAKNAIAAHRTKIAKEKQVQGSAVANELAALHPARIEDAAVVLAALRDKANAGDPVATQAIKDISTGGKLAEDTRIKDIVANEARLQANGELAVARAETGVTGAINTLVDHPAGNGNENANANATAAANAAKNAIAAHRTKIAKEKQVQGSAVANELAALHPARIEDAAVVLAALRDKANAGDPVATQAIKDISTGGKLAEDTRIKDIVANEARLQANGELAVARAETGVTGAINTLVDHPAGNGNENANANATAAANAAKNAIAAHRTKIAKEKQVQGSAVANELAALHPARIEDAAVVLAALRDKANAGDPVATQAIKDISTGGKLAEDTRIKDIVANEARLQANGELAVARAETGVTGAINTLVDHPAGNGNENANANATAAANAAKNAIAAHRTKIAKEKQVQGSAVANELAALHPARIEDAAVVLAALRDKANAGDPVATQAIKDISTGGKLAEDTRIKDIVANEARLQANGELAVARAETGVTGAINTLVDHPAGNGNENANANATAAANAAKNAIAAHRTKIAKEKQVQGSAVANELAALHPARIEDAAVVLAALRDKANAGDPVATQAIKDISTGGKLAEDTRIKDIVANEARLQANGELAVARAETGVTGAINTLVDHPAGNGNENANANATAAANAAKNAIAAHRTKIAKEKQVQGSAVANELAALHPARIEDAAVVLAALRDKANAGDPVATQAIKDISTGGKLAEDTRIKDIVANEARLQANGELAVARAETGVTGAINTLVDHPAGNGNENANANATAAANAAKNAIAAHRTKIAKEKQVQGSAVANELAALHPARIEDAAVVLAALRDKANAGDPVATQAIKDISTGGKLAEDTRIKDIVANEARLQANGELAVARAETGVTGAINTLVDHPAGNGNENANANATAAANAAKNAIAAHRTKIAKEKQVQGSAVANELAALHPARIEDAAVVLAALRDKANAGDPVATQAIKDISTGGKLAEDTRIKDIVANEARLQANGELAVARAETGVTGAINTLVDHPAGNGNENANANATAAANAAKNAIAAHRTKIAKEKQVQGSAVANELAALHPARIEDAAVVLAALRDKANAGDPVATQAIKDISTGGKLAEDTRIKDIVANEARLQANGELAVARAETGVTGAINTLVDHPAGNGNENANANATAAANAAKNAIAAHRTKIAKEKQVQGSAVANELAALHPARIEDAAVVLAALRDKANAGDPVATQAIKDISTGGKLAEDTRIKDIVANEARLQANGELAVARAETGVTGAINTLVDHPAGNGNENANANATAAANAAKNAIAAHRTKIAKEKQVQGSAVANELAALHPARIEDAAVVLAALRDKANAGDPVATQAIKDISTGGKLAEDTRIKDIVANEARLQANGELAVARAETGVTGAINTLVDHPAGNGNENANANATAAANAAKNAIAAHRTKIAKEKQVQGSAVANELAALHPARIEDAAVVLAALRDKANAGDPVATQAIKDISTGGKLAEDTRIKDIVANEARLQANGELAVARAETGVTGAINTLVDHPAGNGNENANANATAAANAAKNAIAAHRTKIAKEKQVQGSAVANELAALHPARIEDAAVVLAALRDKANAGDPVATQAIKDISTGGKLAEDTRIKDIVANEARLQANGELAVARAETGVTGAINTLVDHPAGNGNENANANATAAANAAKNAIAAHRTQTLANQQAQGIEDIITQIAGAGAADVQAAAVVVKQLRALANGAPADPVAVAVIDELERKATPPAVGGVAHTQQPKLVAILAAEGRHPISDPVTWAMIQAHNVGGNTLRRLVEQMVNPVNFANAQENTDEAIAHARAALALPRVKAEIETEQKAVAIAEIIRRKANAGNPASDLPSILNVASAISVTDQKVATKLCQGLKDSARGNVNNLREINEALNGAVHNPKVSAETLAEVVAALKLAAAPAAEAIDAAITKDRQRLADAKNKSDLQEAQKKQADKLFQKLQKIAAKKEDEVAALFTQFSESPIAALVREKFKEEVEKGEPWAVHLYEKEQSIAPALREQLQQSEEVQNAVAKMFDAKNAGQEGKMVDATIKATSAVIEAHKKSLHPAKKVKVKKFNDKDAYKKCDENLFRAPNTFEVATSPRTKYREEMYNSTSYGLTSLFCLAGTGLGVAAIAFMSLASWLLPVIIVASSIVALVGLGTGYMAYKENERENEAIAAASQREVKSLNGSRFAVAGMGVAKAEVEATPALKMERKTDPNLPSTDVFEPKGDPLSRGARGARRS